MNWSASQRAVNLPITPCAPSSIRDDVPILPARFGSSISRSEIPFRSSWLMNDDASIDRNHASMRSSWAMHCDPRLRTLRACQEAFFLYLELHDISLPVSARASPHASSAPAVG